MGLVATQNLMSKVDPKRFRARREELKLSQQDLADEVGMSQQGIVKIEKGLSERPRLLTELAKALDVPPSWLLGDNSQDADFSVKNISDKIVSVPQYEFRAGMGGGGIIIDESPSSFLPLPSEYIAEMRLEAARLIGFDVEGDSMAPTLFSGDRVLANTIDKNPARGGIFAIFDSDTLVVKRIEKIPNTSDPVMLRLISDNSNHNSYDVIADDTNIIGRIVWFARRI